MFRHVSPLRFSLCLSVKNSFCSKAPNEISEKQRQPNFLATKAIRELYFNFLFHHASVLFEWWADYGFAALKCHQNWPKSCTIWKREKVLLCEKLNFPPSSKAHTNTKAKRRKTVAEHFVHPLRLWVSFFSTFIFSRKALFGQQTITKITPQLAQLYKSGTRWPH